MKLTIKKIRKTLEKMKQAQIRPDMNGDIRFVMDTKGRWHPVDERDSWLSGKPVGGK